MTTDAAAVEGLVERLLYHRKVAAGKGQLELAETIMEAEMLIRRAALNDTLRSGG